MEKKKRYDGVTRPFGILGINIGIATSLFLTPEIFLKFASQYSLLCLVIQHQHHFAIITHSLRFPLHPFRGIHWCSRKNVVWFFRSTCQLFLWKQLLRKFLSKTCMVESFLSTLAVLHGIFSKDYLGQLFCIEPVSAWFYKKRNSTADFVSRILWNFKNKRVWRLYNLLVVALLFTK